MSNKEFYFCPICRNLFGIVNDSGVTPVCCDQEMQKLAPGSTDASTEKHVPVIERDGNKLTVKVGSAAHPMLEEHYIQWIVALQGDKYQRAVLRPGQPPEATFTLDCDTEPVRVLEHCNLHGLWESVG